MELRFVSVDEWIARADERYPCDLPVFNVTDPSGRVLTIKPFVALCRDVAIVGGDWIPFYRDGTALLEQMVHTPENYLRKAINIESDGVGHTLVRPIEQIDEDVVLIAGRDNYYHWLLDFLPRILLARDVIGERKLVVNRDLAAYQLESLRALGYESRQLLPVGDDQVVQPRSTLVPSLLSQTTVPHKAALSMLREAFPPTRPWPHERIYVSRQDAARRTLADEKALMDVLDRYGFHRVVPGKMTFEEQRNVFAGARAIIGLNGAAMTNMVFSPPGAEVFEVCLPDFRPTFLPVLASFCRHRHQFVTAHAITTGTDTDRFQGRWQMDLAELKRVLESRFGPA